MAALESRKHSPSVRQRNNPFMKKEKSDNDLIVLCAGQKPTSSQTTT